MGANENRIAVRRFLDDIWSKGDMDAVDELLAPDFEAFKNLVHANRTAFQNLTYRAAPGDVVAEDDKAAAYWTMSAKHVGAWAGIEATGIDVSIEGMTFFRFGADGKIIDARVQNDVRGLRSQLGAT